MARMTVKAIVLAAGFGTRMGELGHACPKGLFEIGDRKLMDPILDDLDRCPRIEEIVWVTNSRFVDDYDDWLLARDPDTEWRLIDDGVAEPEQRLGATGDLKLALDEIGPGPALVLGSDNLYTFRVTDAIGAMETSGASAVAVLEARTPEEMRAANCVELGADGRIVRMVEKPAEPFSRLFVPPVYGYSARALSMVDEYLDSGGDPDAPGHFCAWLCDRVPVWAWLPPDGRRLDVGTPEGLERARSEASGG